MTDASLTLSSDILELRLSPSIGGAISDFAWKDGGDRRPILRESHTPLENVLDASCFPLVPFVNRIRGGCFTFRGRQVRLSPNMAGDPSPLHGQGWTSPWRVESRADSQAVLAFDHRSGEWPWTYEARQTFRIEGNALHLRLECRNNSAEPMPCGLGFHPYFPCGPGTRIQTEVAGVWTVDKDVLPVARMPAEGRYAIGDDPVCSRGLDNGYDGWSESAILTDPDWPFEIELSSPQARYFQLYSPDHGGIFVAEPVTHANAALNEAEEDWPRLGIEILEPGEEMALDARIAVEPR
ncbi:MAG: aldose 1-epimerase [Sphingomicrobium sp.]